MIPKSVMDRIRKCLALGRSANEHEAALALSMARKIMEEHGITDADVAMAEIGEAAARGSRTQRPAQWEGYLCAAVQRAMNVTVFIDERLDRRYVGRGASPEIASYAFTVLFRQLKKARAEYLRSQLRRVRPGRKTKRADVFCEGWALAVHRKIAALYPKPADDPLVDQYLAKHHGDLITVPSRAADTQGGRLSNDLWNGFAHGSDAELHGGVSGNARAKELGHCQ